MKFNIDYPTPLRWLSIAEIKEYNIWLERLVTTLKRFFNSVDDENITSVSADKISGKLSLTKLDLPGASVEVTDSGFSITAMDGTYIKLENGSFSIYANIITQGGES